MIAVDNVTRKYGALTAVDGVSFTVGRDEVVGFVGPNGAGKSTVLKMLSTYIYPTAGAISVAGFDVVEQPLEVRRAIGYLAGDFRWDDHKPVHVAVQQVAGLDGHAVDDHRFAGIEYHRGAVRNHGAAREVMQPQVLDFRQVAHAAVGHQTDAAERPDHRAHHVAAMARLGRVVAGVLNDDD